MGRDRARTGGWCRRRWKVPALPGGPAPPRLLPRGLPTLAAAVFCARFLLAVIKRQGVQLADQREELGRCEASQRQLREHLLVAAERGRRGAALQDGALQCLYAVILDLELAAEDVGLHPDGACERIDRSIDRLSWTIESVRACIASHVSIE